MIPGWPCGSAIISAELVLVLTTSVLAMVVGLNSLGQKINYEMNDLGEAFGAISQTYSFNGIAGCKSIWSGACLRVA